MLVVDQIRIGNFTAGQTCLSFFDLDVFVLITAVVLNKTHCSQNIRIMVSDLTTVALLAANVEGLPCVEEDGCHVKSLAAKSLGSKLHPLAPLVLRLRHQLQPSVGSVEAEGSTADAKLQSSNRQLSFKHHYPGEQSHDYCHAHLSNR